MANREQRSISLLNKANGALHHLNYPQPLPSNIDFTQHIIVPLGEVILLEIYNVGISDSDCHSANRIEVCLHNPHVIYVLPNVISCINQNILCFCVFRFMIIMRISMVHFGIYVSFHRMMTITEEMHYCCHHRFT